MELPHHGIVAAAYGVTERVVCGQAVVLLLLAVVLLVCWLLHQAVCHPTWTIKALVYH